MQTGSKVALSTTRQKSAEKRDFSNYSFLNFDSLQGVSRLENETKEKEREDSVFWWRKG